MNPAKLLFTALLCCLLPAVTAPAAPTRQAITMTLPESVVQEAISKSLPLEFKARSETLVGTISIDKIKGLQFHKNKLSGHVTLTGHKLNLVANIAGHDLRMKLGSLTMGFQCDATIRFDALRQTLYIRPTVTGVQSTNKQTTDIASALTLLFNNREFPLQIDKLQPIVTEAGSKLLSISMNINDILLQPDRMLLRIKPLITSRSRQKRVGSESPRPPVPSIREQDIPMAKKGI